MKKLGLLSAAIGAAVLTATPLSVHVSTTMTPSLSLDRADARVGRPLTPVSVAGVNRRQNRRAGYGYGAGAVGVGLGAAAIGTAAVAARAAPYYGGGNSYSNSYGYYPDQNAAYSNAYASYPVQGATAPALPAGTFCVPGEMVQMDDGEMHLCQ